jgi:hypothetical protein
LFDLSDGLTKRNAEGLADRGLHLPVTLGYLDWRLVSFRPSRSIHQAPQSEYFCFLSSRATE